MGHLTYLVLILGWALPIIALQWLLGADLLIRRWKVLILGILIPTFYLTVIDSFALRAGTWTISPLHSLNSFLPMIRVPLEEAIFFLVTNTLLIQGVILFRERSRIMSRVGGLLSRGLKHPVTIGIRQFLNENEEPLAKH